MAVAFEGVVGSGSGSTVTLSEDIPGSSCETGYWLLVVGAAAYGQQFDPAGPDFVSAPYLSPPYVIPTSFNVYDKAAGPFNEAGPDYCYPRGSEWKTLTSLTPSCVTGWPQGGPRLTDIGLQVQMFSVSTFVYQAIAAGTDITIVAPAPRGGIYDITPISWVAVLFSGVDEQFSDVFTCDTGLSPVVPVTDDCKGGALVGTVNPLTGSNCFTPLPNGGLFLGAACAAGFIVDNLLVGTIDPGLPAWDFTTVADWSGTITFTLFEGTDPPIMQTIPWRAAFGYKIGGSVATNVQFACPGHITQGGTTHYLLYTRQGVALVMDDGPGLCCPPLATHVRRTFRAAPA